MEFITDNYDLDIIRNATDKRVVLLQSGGLDSCVLASVFSYYGFEIEHVFVDYGQNQVEQERKMVDKIALEYGGIVHEVKLNLPWLRESTNCVGGVVADWEAEGELNCVEALTYIPIRNQMFVSIASSLAEAKKIKYIAFGFDGGEDEEGNPTGGTTDKHPTFTNYLELTTNEGSAMKHVHKDSFVFLTPIMGFTKDMTILLGKHYQTDFSLSWSCYNSNEKPCLSCSACRARQEGFTEANMIDPLTLNYTLK